MCHSDKNSSIENQFEVWNEQEYEQEPSIINSTDQDVENSRVIAGNIRMLPNQNNQLHNNSTVNQGNFNRRRIADHQIIIPASTNRQRDIPNNVRQNDPRKYIVGNKYL